MAAVRGPEKRAASVASQPNDQAQAGGPDRGPEVLRSPDGLSGWASGRLPSWGQCDLQAADMADPELGGIHMHLLDEAHDAEPVSPASAERLLQAGGLGDDLLAAADVLTYNMTSNKGGGAGGQKVAGGAGGVAPDAARPVSGAKLAAGVYGSAGAGTVVAAAPVSAYGVAGAAGVGAAVGVQPALHAEFVRILSTLPEAARVGVLQQVGPAGICQLCARVS
jgi:hypothetical protein